jgi:succinylglutamic semialdehyde dehydrogenase
MLDAVHLIAGQWRNGHGAELRCINPADGAATFTAASANAADVAAAIAAARTAFPAWARTPLPERIAIAERYAALIAQRGETLARAIAEDMGKPLWEARSEVQTVVGKVALSIKAQTERAGRRAESAAFGEVVLDHRPHGVLSVFGPYNFPAHLPNGHIVPALLAGNTIVFKPSELAPRAGALMAQAWIDSGLPAGVLNLVQGGRDTGAALLNSAIDGVLFTGSAQTGAFIHRHFAGRPEVILALEMGGNNPLIVWPPADVAAAANLVAHSAFLSAGQRCSCARRLIIPDDGYGEMLIEAVVALAGKLVPQRFDADPPAFMGPLVSERAALAGETAAADLVAKGGVWIKPWARTGAFMTPGVIDVTAMADRPDTEVFAPLLQIQRVRNIDAAFAAANATRFGLAGGLISDDAALWARAQLEMRAGVLNWNRPTTGASGALPFGGPGLSGNGRPSAWYAADYCAWPVASQTAAKAIALPAPGLPT